LNQRLIYLPVLVLSFAMFGVFWWTLLPPTSSSNVIEVFVLPLLAFSFLHHIGWLGVCKGMPFRTTVRLAALTHIWMLGPLFGAVWSGAYFPLAFSFRWELLARFLLALALWSAFACWQLNRRTQSLELGLAGKFLAFLLLPFITIFIALASPFLMFAAGG